MNQAKDQHLIHQRIQE